MGHVREGGEEFDEFGAGGRFLDVEVVEDDEREDEVGQAGDDADANAQEACAGWSGQRRSKVPRMWLHSLLATW